MLLLCTVANADENIETVSEGAEMSIEIIESTAADRTADENTVEDAEVNEDAAAEDTTAESAAGEVSDEVLTDESAAEQTTALEDETEETADANIMTASDDSSDTWTSVTSMNETRADCDLVTVSGELYAVGGMGTNGYSDTIEKYNSTDNAWETVTTLPDTIKGFGVAAYGTNIYIIGGYSAPSYLSTAWEYDVSSDEWTALADMHEERDQPAVLYMDGKIYAFGGRDMYGFTDSYEYYDFSAKEWKKVTTGYSDSLIRVGAHAQYLGGYVCIYGGIDSDYSYAGVDMYDTSGGLADEEEIIGDGYDGISVAWGEDKALIFAWDEDDSEYDVKEMSVSDGDITLSDVAFENTSSAGKYTEYVIYDGYLYAVGGYNLTSKVYLSTVNKYSVYYEDYSIGDGTISSVVTADGNTFTLNVEAGREYLIFVNVKNISSFDDYTFNIEYTQNAFSVTDGCAMTDVKNKSTGAVNGSDINITEIDTDGMSFKCTEDLSTSVTKTVNVIRLTANASGERTITYSMTED